MDESWVKQMNAFIMAGTRFIDSIRATLPFAIRSHPMTGSGRVCEATSGCFAEAKQEERWLADRPLWSALAGRFGSRLCENPVGKAQPGP
jgi:hypothetical protein